jgi:hypothetical protein
MKNIHILPTDKPSRLYIDNKGKYNLEIGQVDFKTFKNIYITNDEEIKEGDWYASFIFDEKTKWTTTKLDCVVKANLNKTNEYLVEPFSKYCKKIILTTDQDLIADGVQAIDDEFLQWFVKNPSCESVEVSYEVLKPFQSIDKGYILRLPDTDVLEEPKQETAVEWLEFRYKNNINLMDYDFEQAKEMEKQQIVDAHLDGQSFSIAIEEIDYAEQYYNETFKNK